MKLTYHARLHFVVLPAITLIVMFLSTESRSQATAPTPSKPRLMLQGPAENSDAPIIRDAFGQPCLNIEAAARPHVVNPDVLDHVVSLKNNCPRLIKVKVCYFHSERCNAFDVQGYRRVDTILGTMTKIFAFRYSITQK